MEQKRSLNFNTMKKLLTYSILALSIGATAQTLQREVVASMGNTQTNGNVTLSYTVGQPISGFIGETNKLSQGFQQNTVAYQDIDLREGWGMVSARVRPYANEMVEVYSDVVDGLLIAKDNNGNVYMPWRHHNILTKVTSLCFRLNMLLFVALHQVYLTSHV